MLNSLPQVFYFGQIQFLKFRCQKATPGTNGLSSSNLKRRLRLAITFLSWPVLAARSVATRLRNIVAWGPIPPVVENTRPLRVPFSIWVQRSPYFLSLLISRFRFDLLKTCVITMRGYKKPTTTAAKIDTLDLDLKTTASSC